VQAAKDLITKKARKDTKKSIRVPPAPLKLFVSFRVFLWLSELFTRGTAMGIRFNQLAADAKTRIREVSAAEASQEQANGAVLIDVREANEFENGHAKGAVHLSKGVIELRIEETVPNVSTPIICYCGGGSRSALAAENLQKMGYTNVASMAGGFRAWNNEGLPTS
jgi:phage shock protein E